MAVFIRKITEHALINYQRTTPEIKNNFTTQSLILITKENVILGPAKNRHSRFQYLTTSADVLKLSHGHWLRGDKKSYNNAI